jgi:dipeptidyl aminopeptidase/acylaminoacyl peptidase
MLANHKRASWAVLALSAAIAVSSSAAAQHSRNDANWDQAEKFSRSSLQRFVYSSSVTPNWINKTDRFWYYWKDSDGKRFMLVDPAKKKRERLFDHVKLAGALSELGKKPVIGSNLPMTSVKFSEDEKSFEFTVDKVKYSWDIAKETLSIPKKKEGEEEEAAPTPPPGARRFGGEGGGSGYRRLSEDKKAYVYLKGHNLFFVELDEEITEKDNKKKDAAYKEAEKSAVKITEDGTQFNTFVSRNYGQYKRDDKQEKPARASATWAKDSKAFAIVRYDAREVKDLFLVNSLSKPRPTLMTYKYQMPGEEGFQQSTLHIFDRASKTIKEVDVSKWTDQSLMNIHWAEGKSERLRFIRKDRLQRNLEFCEYDVASGELKVLISESVEDAHLERQSVRYVDEDNTGDMIWWSERSGWGHFYHYSHAGELKNAITSGAWRAERISKVDKDDKKMWFSAVGHEAGENIYYTHNFSIKLDGSGMTLLDEGDASHRMSLSDSNKFSVDNYSRVDMVPESVLRDSRGRKVLDLETMDTSNLEEYGWKAPERFTVKSADGITDIYGNMWKPFDFDASKKYPIILYVYPGPQQEAVSSTFSATASMQELAQLGIIVIQIGNRGGTPKRSNAYHSYGYYNLRDYGLPDKKAGTEQLAARHDWIDISRVGIYGHSGGGFMTGAAMLLEPYNEFFTVGVSAAGNHDNNVYNSNWSEQHHGLKIAEKKKEEKKEGDEKKKEGDEEKKKEDEKDKFEIKVPANHELAANLKGHLLLAHGDMDNNVHPAGTIRLVEALIKANKRFDLIILPGQAHGFGSMNNWFSQRRAEFFAEHLLGDNYRKSAQMKEKGK